MYLTVQAKDVREGDVLVNGLLTSASVTKVTHEGDCVQLEIDRGIVLVSRDSLVSVVRAAEPSEGYEHLEEAP